jgi:hypothetical protein
LNKVSEVFGRKKFNPVRICVCLGTTWNQGLNEKIKKSGSKRIYSILLMGSKLFFSLLTKGF